jgi:hypothetical protein
MTRSVLKHLRLLGPLTVAAALSVGTLPAFAQTAPTTTTVGSGPSDCSPIRFELANPSPGARLEPGGLMLQGIATDSRASQGLGISRIDFFLDSRDLGGLSLGSIVPGAVPGPSGYGSWQTTISLPELTGGHDLVAYAQSSVTGAEAVVTVPISIGDVPKTTIDSMPTTIESSCVRGSAATAARTVAPPTTTLPTTIIAAPVGSTSAIRLDVGNPSPNDTIQVGAYSVQGLAMDPAATSGAGIDRVDIFLDSQDSGGMFLGSATPGSSGSWQTVVTLPSNKAGLHALWFYAHSSATGATKAVSVPVEIDK